jgi:hypothetical protein
MDVISVTAECVCDSEGRWKIVDNFITDTKSPIGDPGVYRFDPEDDSYVDAFLDGVSESSEMPAP